jgi:hypothetical protein
MQSQIRETPTQDVPDVERFRRLDEEGRLASPEDAARRIWDAIESGLEPGSVIDVRRR